MSASPLPPGTRVRVMAGTFVTQVGVVVTTEEARLLVAVAGGTPSVLHAPDNGCVWVSLPIFDKEIPVELEEQQLEVIP